MTGAPADRVVGRLVLDDRIVAGAISIEDGRIAGVALDDEPATDGPYICPGFVDVHVHGWGGHDAMGGRAALDGMARRLLRRGVTSFLPTAVTAPLGGARRLRRIGSPLAAGRPGRRSRAARFQPGGSVPCARAPRGARPEPPEGPGRGIPFGARAAPRRAQAHHDRTRAAGRHGSHPLAPRP